MKSDSNIFFAKMLKAVIGSLLLAYVTSFLLSLRLIPDLTFSLYSIFYIPKVFIAVTSFLIVTSCKYIKNNVPSKNRFVNIAKGLSIKTVSLAAVCSTSAWFLSLLNPFDHDEEVWCLLNVGCALTGILFHYENIYFEEEFHFPIIQTTKYSMFMAKLSVIIFKSIKKSIIYLFFIFISLYTIEPKLCSDIYFFGILWRSILLVVYLFHSFEYILYIIMTERVIFPIMTRTEDGNSLLNALNSDNKIIQSLALYDLYKITIQDVNRRKDIFGLSVAGSVPRSWIVIFHYCLNNIKHQIDFNNIVEHATPKIINQRTIQNARLIQINGDSINDKDGKIINKQEFFEKFRMYNYLFELLNVEKTLEELEITVWCCYILSNLAVVSLKEDEYGVIREQLGEIIGTILDLKNKVDLQRKHFDSQKSKNIKYLKTHINTCVVMLALNFATYANDIGLDENHLHIFKKIIL